MIRSMISKLFQKIGWSGLFAFIAIGAVSLGWIFISSVPVNLNTSNTKITQNDTSIKTANVIVDFKDFKHLVGSTYNTSAFNHYNRKVINSCLVTITGKYLFTVKTYKFIEHEDCDSLLVKFQEFPDKWIFKYGMQREYFRIIGWLTYS